MHERLVGPAERSGGERRAERSHISPRTAWRWLKKPAVQRAWAELQSLMLRNVARRLAEEMWQEER